MLETLVPLLSSPALLAGWLALSLVCVAVLLRDFRTANP